jgi:hypothetical protein
MVLRNRYRYGTIVCVLASTLANPIGMAQIDTSMTLPEQDLSDLCERAATSQVVAVGTVVKRDGVSKRMTAELTERMRAEGNLGLALGGTLYTIGIEGTVCRKSDFRPNASSSLETPRKIYIFVPRNESGFVDGHQQENLLPDRRYLLFLVTTNRQTVEKWTETYELDPKQTYYRGEQLSRGIIPLKERPPGSTPSKTDPVLDKVTSLCQALRPSDLRQKLAALKKLEASGDPILEKEARFAAQSLQAMKPK